MKETSSVIETHAASNSSSSSLEAERLRPKTAGPRPRPRTNVRGKPDVVNLGGGDVTADKRREKVVTLCLTNCRYEVVRRTASKFNYREVGENDCWNLYWTDLSISIERCKEMKRYQKINHFPGMLEICRKDLLARNLNRMSRIFPKDYTFFPKTWCLPADLGEAQTYSRLRKNKTFILKPDAGSQGRGIMITKSLRDLKPTDRMICQVYINRPFLIDGYKFDLRVYTLMTSCDPLRVYVYKEGLVRFATSRYKEPNGVNLTNVFMHLTNYAVNKHSRTYNMDTEAGSKRKLSWLNAYLRNAGHDVDRMWQKIDDVIIKTVLCAWPVLKHSYLACFPNHDVVPACCELLGVDILLDRRLNPQILEVNHSPSFHTDTDLDGQVKEALLSDMFLMMNLSGYDKRKIIREDKKRVRERLLHGITSKESASQTETKCFLEHYRHEMANRGSFRLVYPTNHAEHAYAKYFQQGQGSIYCETAASKARETAQTAMRDEIMLKARMEACRRVNPIHKPKLPFNRSDKDTKIMLDFDHKNSSFEPQMIVESEEKERLARLAQRDHLVRSHGLLEQVYFSLKQNGVLRPQDERKFAIFEKIRSSGDTVVEHAHMATRGPAICDLLEGIRGGEANIISRPDLPPTWGVFTRSQLARAMTNVARMTANNTRAAHKITF